MPSLGQKTVTSGTPRSTSRRACSTDWPCGLSPYRSRTAAGSCVQIEGAAAGGRVAASRRPDARGDPSPPASSVGAAPAQLPVQIGQQRRVARRAGPAEISGGRSKIAHVVIRLGRIGVDRQRIERLAQPAGRLPVALLDEPRHVVVELRPQRHERRQRIAAAPQPRQHRADVRPVAAQLGRLRRRLAGEQKVRRRSDGRRRCASSSERSPACRSARPTAESARRSGCPARLVAIGLNSPRISAGAVGLQVPGVLMRRPAPHEQQDAALGPAEGGRQRAVARRILSRPPPQPRAASDRTTAPTNSTRRPATVRGG